MSYVDPKLRGRFESLSIELKNAILQRDVALYTLEDLIGVLEEIVKEGVGKEDGSPWQSRE